MGGGLDTGYGWVRVWLLFVCEGVRAGVGVNLNVGIIVGICVDKRVDAGGYGINGYIYSI